LLAHIFEGVVCTWLIFIPLHQSVLLGWMKILIRVHYYDFISQ